MIVPRHPLVAGQVADHYDELDPLYRRLWGEHVHHGLWATGRETVAEATAALADLVAERLDPRPGDRLLDIGCGYGGTARRIAAAHAVDVTGLTLSPVQAAQAPAQPGVTLLVRDWLASGLANAAYDGAWAIESSEHMMDKQRFFAEAARVLRPGARLVVCAWLAETGASPRKIRHLLEPICREGRLPSMGTREEYQGWAAAVGFVPAGYLDLSRRVARTWTICTGRLARLLLTDRAARQDVLAARNRLFALSLPRLMLAYRTGAMRYGLFVWTRAA